MVKLAIMEIDLYYFLFLRFSVAVVILFGLFFRRLKNYNKRILKDGVILGTVLFSAFIFQTVGLLYTSASNAGFITGLHVVLVPLALAMIFRKMPAITAFSGAAICAFGIFFLIVGEDFTINVGDIWVILCAISVCFHVILTGIYAVRHDTYLLALTQVTTMFVFAGVATLFFVDAPKSLGLLSPYVILTIVVMGIFATAFNFTMMVWAQQYTTPTRAAVIYTLEPVFAAIFAYWWGGEILGSRGYIGAALIFLGIILSEFRAKDWSDEERKRLGNKIE